MLGCLEKMITNLTNPVSYHLPIGEQQILLNPFIGEKIELVYTGKIFCIHCGNKTKKSFNQGYCYPCFLRLAECDMCIMKPETCHYAKGTCRDPNWGETHCFQPHIVYLANSSGIKVGITRKTQVPTRWIDQGAIQALPIMEVSSRHISGLIEVCLAEYVSDKTNWQQMLKNKVEILDLVNIRNALLIECETKLINMQVDWDSNALKLLDNAEIIDIHYPVLEYPSKIKSFNFDSIPKIAGILLGIKGQYLIFDTGVINIRKYAGYEIELSA